MSTETKNINVKGMTCQGCVNSVNRAVTSVEGVQSATVNLADNLATVTFDDSMLDINTVLVAIEDAGFDASLTNT